MPPLGTLCPDFSLTDVISGDSISLDTFKDKKVLLITFTARHCPFAQHVKKEVARIGRDYGDKDFGMVAVCSSDISAYPMDGPDGLKSLAEEIKPDFPLCFDETQEVAKSLHAACTPDFFLFDKDRKLIYRGQLCDSRPGSDIPLTGKDLRAAIDAALNDKPVSQEQKPSIGCSIKWKPGNEPDYAK